MRLKRRDEKNAGTCGREQLQPVIANYNYPLRSLVVVGSAESLGFAPTQSERCPDTQLRCFTPENPEQRVTLSLHSPLMGCLPPENPEQGVALSLHPPIRTPP